MKSHFCLLLTIPILSTQSIAITPYATSTGSSSDSSIITQTNIPHNQGWHPTTSDGSNLLNNGNIYVVGYGYDTMGSSRAIWINITYYNDGLRYHIIVNEAWNPLERVWEYDINSPATDTNIKIKGQTFKFYVILSSGVYYFNI